MKRSGALQRLRAAIGGAKAREEPWRTEVSRTSGVVIAVVAPLLLVFLGTDAISQAVFQSLNGDFAYRLQSAQTDINLQRELSVQIEQAALDRILIIYLFIAAAVASVGASMRALVHGSPTLDGKAFDFTGKCLALSAAVVVGAGGFARVTHAGLDTFIPWYVYIVSIAAFVVIVAILTRLGYLAASAAQAKAETDKLDRQNGAGRGRSVHIVIITVLACLGYVVARVAKPKAKPDLLNPRDESG